MSNSTSGPSTATSKMIFDLPNVGENEDTSAARAILKGQSETTSDTDRGSRGNKAVLNLPALDKTPETHQAEDGNDKNAVTTQPLSFKLIDANKFNPVVPPGQTVKFTFNMDLKTPNSGSTSVETVVRVNNPAGHPPKLLSFSFDENGKPILRSNIKGSEGEANEGQRQYLSIDDIKNNASEHYDQGTAATDKKKAVAEAVLIDLGQDKFKEFAKDLGSDDYLSNNNLSPEEHEAAARAAALSKKYDGYHDLGLAKHNDDGGSIQAQIFAQAIANANANSKVINDFKVTGTAKASENRADTSGDRSISISMERAHEKEAQEHLDDAKSTASSSIINTEKLAQSKQQVLKKLQQREALTLADQETEQTSIERKENTELLRTKNVKTAKREDILHSADEAARDLNNLRFPEDTPRGFVKTAKKVYEVFVTNMLSSTNMDK
ncbi:MAG: hypothetical protein VX185_03195 [Pseudomonadota bacterium]|nr:hypothetical protein [Gammaproteobacteria bacterium]MEC8009753.1 hypothetical protein [Pseudomonadota bacterium]HBF09552.1 hypothetical protein [Gammaproteobacteria bacterium]|tara:strand:+ start:28510 stop:29823 length:1314 start_codon:yes stop_codon:yes gene_type:complete